MGFTLYELTGSYKELLELVETSNDDTAFTDTLESLEEAIEDKAENICKLLRTMQTEVEAIKSEKQRLEQMIAVRQNKIKNLKDYLELQLDQAGLQKIRTGLFSVWIQKSNPSLIIENEEKVPEQFVITEKRFDKKALAEFIKQGNEIEGIELKQSKGIRFK